MSPLRIAVVGSGPAAFFTVEHLLRRGEDVAVDILERLPAPYGLVRYGVAPDHQKIKSVERGFAKTAGDPRVRFFGNVEVGRGVPLEELARYYHAVVLATGAQTDRRLGIPGEDLGGSHAATEFVAWYNGHPDFQDRVFDLSAERVVVIGVGNVAVDVARILCRTRAELAATDITDPALEAIANAGVREVVMCGRRGPAQAAFTNPEVRELGDLPGADIAVRADEVALDPASASALELEPDRATSKKLEILAGLAAQEAAGKPRRLAIRFCVSPVELLGDARGHVRAVRLVRNRLEERDGRIHAVATDEVEEIPAGLVFRSVGYRGVPVPGAPFDERTGTVPNVDGRVTDAETGAPVPGLYAAGWIKRGPSGVIGTNKADAGETVDRLLADHAAGVLRDPVEHADAVDARLREAGPVVTWDDWTTLNDAEVAAGEADGKPRVKLVRVEDMLGSRRGGT